MAFVFLTIVGFMNSCGSSKSRSTSSSTDNKTTSTTSGSSVDDSAAQKQTTASLVDSAIGALSDGGSGSTGGGGTATDLLDWGLKDFAETKVCTATTLSAATTITGGDASTWTLASGTPYVTVARTDTGVVGARTYETNADGSPSGIAENWYPGPAYGILNITADTGMNYGTVSASSTTVPSIPAALSGATAKSSGALGSVGWRSIDGSWFGAPVWEVGTGYVGVVNGTALSAGSTEGMVMYYTTKMPTVTAASTTPTIGGAYSPTVMKKPKAASNSVYSVLGVLGGGALPSFTANGMAVISDVETSVNQAGTVTASGIPGRIFNPPTTLLCASDGSNPSVGWRFSQNVAQLTRSFKSNLTYTKTYKKGTASYTESSNNIMTWADPALSAPYTNSTPGAYFDENAGILTLNRSLTMGSKASPNTHTVTYTPKSGTAQKTVSHAVYTTAPFVDTITRDLNNGWAWKTKTVASGTISASETIGGAAAKANITTSFSNVVFTRTTTTAKSCVPTAGTITTVITPVDTTKQITTITLKFGTTVGISSASGVTSTVICTAQDASSSSATNCTAQAEMDDADYKPTGCNF